MTDATLSDLVAAAITRQRKASGLNRESLAARCAALGHPEITAAALANIETGRPGPDGSRRRDITVDELAVFAAALKIAEPWSLTEPPACETCQGAPPPGFTCNDCGAGDSYTAERRDRRMVAPRLRRIITPVLLKEVADVYRSALAEGRPPNVAVARHFVTSHRTATRWVREARKAGVMGASLGTRPGEAEQGAA